MIGTWNYGTGRRKSSVARVFIKRGSGQIIVNPPWTLEQDLEVILPALAKVLAPGIKAAVRIDRLAAKA